MVRVRGYSRDGVLGVLAMLWVWVLHGVWMGLGPRWIGLVGGVTLGS